MASPNCMYLPHPFVCVEFKNINKPNRNFTILPSKGPVQLHWDTRVFPSLSACSSWEWKGLARYRALSSPSCLHVCARLSCLCPQPVVLRNSKEPGASWRQVPFFSEIHERSIPRLPELWRRCSYFRSCHSCFRGDADKSVTTSFLYPSHSLSFIFFPTSIAFINILSRFHVSCSHTGQQTVDLSECCGQALAPCNPLETQVSFTAFASGKTAAEGLTWPVSDLSEGAKGAVVKIRMKLGERGLCIDGKAVNVPLGKKYLKHEKHPDTCAEVSPHLLML